MSFAKHETFHLREGWLFKGMSAIKKAETEGRPATIFLDRDGPERLGIGRNMVRALRFWMQATGLAQEDRDAATGKTQQQLTPFGEWVWQYDRYLDDETTLWLIHYQLICDQDQATTWYWFFNRFAPVTFAPDDCLEALKLWVISDYGERKIATNSLQKDLTCLLRTYIPGRRRQTPEAGTTSPLTRLGLLSQVGERKRERYRLERADSARLAPLLILYVLCDQQKRQRPDTDQIGLAQVLREPMNAGRVFNLTTVALADLLADLNKAHPDWAVRFVRTAGLDQLTLPNIKPAEILKRYTAERAERAKRLPGQHLIPEPPAGLPHEGQPLEEVC